MVIKLWQCIYTLYFALNYKRNENMKKKVLIPLIVITSIIVLSGCFIAVYFLWPWNKDFFDKAQKEFDIPGLDENFVPQGLSFVDGTNDFLVCGYMNDNKPSRIYYISGENHDEVKYITLKMSDSDADYVGHAGGIASYGNSIWVSGDGYIYRLTFSDLNGADNGDSIYMKAYMSTGNGADFVYANNGTLWVGEFYKEGKYDTLKSHHLKTRSGETNRAIAFGFVIDESRNIGLQYKTYDKIVPKRALSLPDLVQGMSFSSDGKILLSTSWSIADSTLKYYKNVFSEDAHSTVRYGLDTVDLWYLDNEALISNNKIPSMSEEIVIKNDMAYILFESGCKKYKMVNRRSIKNVYSLPVSYLKNED